MRLSHLRPAHQIRLLQGGQEFFAALIAAVDGAVHDVRMETYIFCFDASGQPVAAALERAARRGIRVSLVMDGVGTSEVPAEWAQRLTQAGVQWRIFSPMGLLGLLNPGHWRRLHRKLCVVDGQVAFCGGINVLDDFEDPNHGVLPAPRFDFAVQITGPLVEEVHDAMDQLWWRFQAVRQVRRRDFKGVWKAVRAAVQAARQPDAPLASPAPGYTSHNARAALLLRDNLRNRRSIERAYSKAIGEARNEIIIANAYFMPGGRLRRALRMAARRGVKVQLLLQGRYEYFMQYHAARPVYGALLAAGVEIHEYAPSFLHAKVAVIDGHWATVGSSNLDPLSFLLAREANIVVDDTVFASALRERLVLAMREAGQQMNIATFEGRSLSQRGLDWLAYGLMRLALLVTGNRY
ncbi:MAG: cardiolipin synthase ClsB [Pseudomonadota bacterium]